MRFSNNKKVSEGLYSEYYDEAITIEETNKAIEKYLDWCKEQGLKPEIENGQTALEIPECQFEHVLYHYREIIK